MSSKHGNPVIIILNTSLVSCLILASVSGSKSYSDSRGTSDRTGELDRDPRLSSPVECARRCVAGEPPKTCYYHFTLENYVVGGSACELCTPNATNALENNCQCVQADGVERTILTVNRMIPGPSIQVCLNDKVVIDVHNKMEGMETTIHWHGIWQQGSQYYDGVPFVTQCPILQGTTFRYQWIAGNPGTHFWHSHSGLQKLDGIYGSLIVREPSCNDPNSHRYDEDSFDHVILLSDWMHEHAVERFPGRLTSRVGQTPESVLINGKGRYTSRTDNTTTNTPLEVFEVEQGRRYRFRMINSMCSVCPAELNIQGHDFTVIATDGEPIHPVKVNTIISFSGERYDFVINANQTPGTYWIQYRARRECAEDGVQQIALLRYKGGPEMPRDAAPTYANGLPSGVILNPLDTICDIPRMDAICISQLKPARSVDRRILNLEPDVKIFLPFRFYSYTPQELYEPGTYNHYLVPPTGEILEVDIDGISYESPPSPLLSQIDDIPKKNICNSNKEPASCTTSAPCQCTHRIDIPRDSVVEVILIDEMGVPELFHPFHLHGYAFNVVGMGQSNVTKMNLQHARNLEEQGLLIRNWKMLPYKDNIGVPANGYVVLRFIANNPGEWLFHCHFLFHIPIGMEVVFHVGERKDLPPVPKGFPKCGNYLPPIRDSHDKSNNAYSSIFH